MGTQVDWSGYDNWLNKDNPYENDTDEDENEDETCELDEGYCDCQNSDCANPTPKG